MNFRAVAFDIDGTLYPNYRFYIRVAPFAVCHLRLMLALGRVRKELRTLSIPPGTGSFYREQGRLLAREMGMTPEAAIQFIEQKIYRGWEPIFARVKPYAHLKETLAALKTGGLKLGVLSDFPAVSKLSYLGLSPYWDVVLCSEEVGNLKPAPEPFQMLARHLGCEPAEILYVGNSYGYDVQGARAAGFGTAIITPPWKRVPDAGFAFSDYRKLQKYVLNDLY